MHKLALPVALLLLQLACGGGGEADKVEPVPLAKDHGGDHGKAPAPKAQPIQAIGGLDEALPCPEGTTMQQSESTAGTERWCDLAGQMHGPYVKYFADGQKAIEGRYTNNLQDKLWIWWFPSSTKSSKGTYDKGKQSGSWTWWHENGNRKEEGDFLRGRRAGMWISWFDSGNKAEEGLYHNGNKNGTWTYFYDDELGSKQRIETWNLGEMTKDKEFDPPNPIR